MNEQWVQSIYSKDAKKWKLAQIEPGDSSEYIVYGEGCVTHYVPKSEYAPCEPPERWVNVTDRLRTCTITPGSHAVGLWGNIIVGEGYRVRKVEANLVDGGEKAWVLVLEKKVQP